MIDKDQLREALKHPDVLLAAGLERPVFLDAEELLDAVIEAARLVADPNTLTISKVDGEWPDDVVEAAARLMFGRWRTRENTVALADVRACLDALLEKPK